MVRHRRRVGPADGEERLRAGRVPRVVGRAVPAGEPRSTAPTATCTSSTCIAASCRPAASGARTSPTTSRRTTWNCRSAGGGSGAWCYGQRHGAASRGAGAVEGDAAAAGADAVESEGLVARYGAAAARRARRRVRRAGAEDAGRQRARLAHAAARAVDARRPRRDRRGAVQKALADANADVRASAVRLSERWLGQDAALRRRGAQAAGRQELERAAAGGRVDRRDACRGSRRSGDRALLTRDGADPIIVDATISSLKGLRSRRADGA